MIFSMPVEVHVPQHDVGAGLFDHFAQWGVQQLHHVLGRFLTLGRVAGAGVHNDGVAAVLHVVADELAHATLVRHLLVQRDQLRHAVFAQDSFLALRVVVGRDALEDQIASPRDSDGLVVVVLVVRQVLHALTALQMFVARHHTGLNLGVLRGHASHGHEIALGRR
jgi:hypothetical protein